MGDSIKRPGSRKSWLDQLDNLQTVTLRTGINHPSLLVLCKDHPIFMPVHYKNAQNAQNEPIDIQDGGVSVDVSCGLR
jgi:hypothetical protein